MGSKHSSESALASASAGNTAIDARPATQRKKKKPRTGMHALSRAWHALCQRPVQQQCYPPYRHVQVEFFRLENFGGTRSAKLTLIPNSLAARSPSIRPEYSASLFVRPCPTHTLPLQTSTRAPLPSSLVAAEQATNERCVAAEGEANQVGERNGAGLPKKPLLSAVLF